MCWIGRLPDEEAGKVPAACVVLNQNAKESEGEIMNYVSCNVVHYKRVIVLQWTQFQNHFKEYKRKKNAKQVNKLASGPETNEWKHGTIYLKYDGNRLFWGNDFEIGQLVSGIVPATNKGFQVRHQC